MSPLPQELVDRWQNRRESAPGDGTVYWHVLLSEDAKLRSVVEDAHGRLCKFPGLHLTPLRWLHITTLIAGSADDIAESDMSEMLAKARVLLSDRAPIQVTFRRVFYHPEAIVLGIHPHEALAPIREAALAATRAVTGQDGNVSGSAQPWMPHVTLCYSTGRQPAEPIIAALGKELPACDVTIHALSLVVQRGPERLWDWNHIGTARLGTPDQHLHSRRLLTVTGVGREPAPGVPARQPRP
jgi:2'-5' RNA ligase